MKPEIALNIIGWDVGGAHLKAVQMNALGQVLAVSQVYCPLWRGLHELEIATEKVLAEFNVKAQSCTHFVTMTGELADIFANRHTGVVQIAQLLTQKLAAKVMFYAAEKGFVMLDVVAKHTVDIASMNWLASVQCLAKNRPQAILIDIGSTTTDIALIRNGLVDVLGFNDAQRMQADELVYTGVVRTPLMALAQKIPFAGNMVNVAAEHFATTADVYTLTGDLPVTENMAETADGAEKTVEASARRIARMIGWDAQDAPLSAWRHLAQAFKQAQLNMIKQAVLRKISLLEDTLDFCLVGAGTGDFLILELAQQLGLNYEPISHVIMTANNLKTNTLKTSDEISNMAAICFPAYAVASLGRVAEL